MSRFILRTGTAGIILLAIGRIAFAQGSLTPPGPPGPTMRSLDEVEPRRPVGPIFTPGDGTYAFVISSPGSYYLTNPLAISTTHGIHITAAGVTLDLSGFDIRRQAGSGGDAITIDSTAHRCTIKNGTINGFANGINSLFATTYARACAFRDLAVSGCTSSGIFAGGGAVLESCRAHDNSGTYGIYADTGATLTNCAALKNTATYGIYANYGSALTNCTAFGNTATYGIYVFGGSSLTNCSASENTNAGAVSGGIGTGGGCTISHCTALLNTSTATSTSDTGIGFDMGGGNTIQGCTANLNEGDGIYISSNSVARDNTSSGNGNSGNGAGIHVTGSDNRIEGNNVTDNDRGIDVDVAGNFIIKNSASGNGANYDFVANNVFGAIVDRIVPASLLVLGNSAPSSAGTVDPWANFAY